MTFEFEPNHILHKSCDGKQAMVSHSNPDKILQRDSETRPIGELRAKKSKT